MKHKRVFGTEQLKEMGKDFDIRDILKNYAYQNKPIDFEKAYLLGIYTLFPYREGLEGIFKDTKELAARHSLSALSAFHNRATYNYQENGNPIYPAAAQIAGICAAVFDYDIGQSTKGFLIPNVSFAIDNCGMGGDIMVTPNVSTAAALIAAASGIPMCKHGSPANADMGRHGSSDFIANILLELESHEDLFSITKEKMEEAIEKLKFGYTEALDIGYKVIHKQTHEYAKIPHMNDIIGPITNPLHPTIATKKIIGVNQLVKPVIIAQTYKILNEKGVTNIEDGIFVRGFVFEDRQGPKKDDGMDELSTMGGGTLVARLNKEIISEYNLYAPDFGVKTSYYENIKPPMINGKYQKGQFSFQILQNKVEGPAKELILVNAALIEHLANGTELKESYKKMRDTLESQQAYKNIKELKEFLRE